MSVRDLREGVHADIQRKKSPYIAIIKKSLCFDILGGFKKTCVCCHPLHFGVQLDTTCVAERSQVLAPSVAIHVLQGAFSGVVEMKETILISCSSVSLGCAT